jgi:hypothetical protein
MVPLEWPAKYLSPRGGPDTRRSAHIGFGPFADTTSAAVKVTPPGRLRERHDRSDNLSELQAAKCHGHGFLLGVRREQGRSPVVHREQLHRQRARSYSSSSSGEWWELWGLDWGMSLAGCALVGGLGYLLVPLL